MGSVCSSLGICESADDQRTDKIDGKVDDKIDNNVDDNVDDSVDDKIDDKVDDDGDADDDDVYVWLIRDLDLRMHSAFPRTRSELLICMFILNTKFWKHVIIFLRGNSKTFILRG